jgi:ribosomal-protein-alanine N-acetyltransferase
MKITFSPLDEADVEEITGWQYQPPYDIYNLKGDQETIQYVLDPQNCFHGLFDKAGDLIGFCSFGTDGQVAGGDYRLEALDIGMGIHPDHIGQGLGKEYVSAVLAYALDKFDPRCFRVTIAGFNRRAQRVWEGNGFQKAQHFTHKASGREFLVYVLDVKTG